MAPKVLRDLCLLKKIVFGLYCSNFLAGKNNRLLRLRLKQLLQQKGILGPISPNKPPIMGPKTKPIPNPAPM